MKGSFSKEIHTGSNDYRTLKYFSQMTFIFLLLFGLLAEKPKEQQKINLFEKTFFWKLLKKEEIDDDDFIFVKLSLLLFI